MRKLFILLILFLGVLVLNGCSTGYHTSAHIETYFRRVPAYNYYYGYPAYPGYYYGPSIHYDLGHHGFHNSGGHNGCAGGHNEGHHGHYF